MSAPAYTMLVNSTDSFRDCWSPFFTLLDAHWPTDRPSIVLNTETGTFSHPGLEIAASRVARPGERKPPTWSECLGRCLEGITSDVVLYMQEDYFVNGPVDAELVDWCAGHLRERGAGCLRLMECGGAGPWTPTATDGVWRVEPSSRYYISLQAALWDRRALLRCLRRHEAPWALELLGSRRAARSGIPMLCLDRDRYGTANAPVPYVPTGIVKGRWNRDAVVELFADHRIEVDFDRRGFFVPGETPPPAKRPLVPRIVDRIRSL